MSWVNKPINEKRAFTEYEVASATSDFQIGFEFDEDLNNLNITLDNKDVIGLGYTVDLINDQTLKLTPSIDTGVLRIARETDIDDSIHKFTAGALFEARQMDENFEQVIHSQQEVRDLQIALEGRVVPVIDGLEEALVKADEASKAAQEAAEKASEAAELTKSTLNVLSPDGMTQDAINRGVKSKVVLQSLKPVQGTRVTLISINDGQHEGGGDFVAITTNVKSDGGTVIDSSSVGIKWVRINYTYVTPEMFGAVGDGVANDLNALQAAIDRNLKVKLGNKTYLIDNALRLNSRTDIQGVNVELSIIRKVGTRSDTGFGSFDGTSFEVDAILVPHPYVYNLKLSDFSIDRINSAGMVNPDGRRTYKTADNTSYSVVPTGYGLFTNALAKGILRNFESHCSEYPIYVKDSWLSSWINVHVDGCQGLTIVTGTSNTFIDVWSTNTSWNTANKKYVAFDVGGYYNNFISVASDHAGAMGKPCESIWRLSKGNHTFGSIGIEGCHTNRLVHVTGNETTVHIDNIFGVSVNNNYAGSSVGLFTVSDLAHLSINSGELRTVHGSGVSNRNIFADVRVAGKLTVGGIKLNHKISGLNDDTYNQVLVESGASFKLDSPNTTIVLPTDSSNLSWAEDTYAGKYAGSYSVLGDMYVSAPKDINLVLNSNVSRGSATLCVGSMDVFNNSTIEFRNSGTSNIDASIKLTAASSKSSADYTQSLEYAALNHDFYGSVRLRSANTVGATSNVYMQPDGTLTRTSSTIRYKENVNSIKLSDAMRIVHALNPVTFTSKGTLDAGTQHYGLIAEEVAKVEPRLCFWNGSEVEGVQYDRLVPLIIKCIQELTK